MVKKRGSRFGKKFELCNWSKKLFFFDVANFHFIYIILFH